MSLTYSVLWMLFIPVGGVDLFLPAYLCGLAIWKLVFCYAIQTHHKCIDVLQNCSFSYSGVWQLVYLASLCV